MAPGLARRFLCSNKNAEEQKQEELGLALGQLRNRHNRYRDSVSAIGERGVAMADATEIARTINTLAESLRESGMMVDGDMSSDLNQSLLQASEKLQAYTEQLSRSSPQAAQKVTFYNKSYLPTSPQRHNREKTPKRSNCTVSDELLHATSPAALSGRSGYLATIGDEEDEDDEEEDTKTGFRDLTIPQPQKPNPRVMHTRQQTPKRFTGGKKGKKLSLTFNESPSKGKANRQIRISDGKNDIVIWGPSMKGLTLQTGSSCSSTENHKFDPDGQKLLKGNTQKNACVSQRCAPPESARGAPHAVTNHAESKMERLVLGAMKTPSQVQTAKKAAVVVHDKILSSSSSISEFLPPDRHDQKKCKSVKNDGEKGFEVFLDEKAQTKRYSTDKLRERADFSERLQMKRREILDIKQDLELCSKLLDKCNEGTALCYGETSKEKLPGIEERRFISKKRRPKTPSNSAESPRIIRE